jgi:GNAT acetyltransferase-like protein
MTEPEITSESKYVARRLETREDLERWEAFMAASPQVNPFSTWTWLESAGREVGAESEIWIVERSGQWMAGVPLTSRRVAGRWHMGLPLAAYNTFHYRPTRDAHPSSVTAEHLDVSRALIEATRGRLKNWDLMLSPTIDDVRPWTWSGWLAKPRYTYVLDLAQPLSLTHAARKHVRKCQEASMVLDTSWNLDALCAVFESTKERQGFGMRLSMPSFRRLSERLHEAGIATMAIARAADGEPAAGHILLAVPGVLLTFHWAIGTHARHLTGGASTWLMVETAAELARRGFRQWDLCGADFPSIARFKSHLGGPLVHYFQVEAPRGAIESAYTNLKTSWRALRRPGGAPKR